MKTYSAYVAVHRFGDVDAFVTIIGQPALSLGGTDDECRDEKVVLNEELHGEAV